MMKGTGNNYTIPPLYNGSTGWMFTSIFDNIACVRGTTFGGSLLESLIDVIGQKYWLRKSAFVLSSWVETN
jgi:hypothetical protein